MDMVLQTLGQLGANVSFWYQFVIFAVLFFLSKAIFTNILQNVLDSRHEKTTGLSQQADEQLKEINRISNNVRESLNKSKKEIREEFSEKKARLIKDLEKEYRKTEKEVSSYSNKIRKESMVELEQVKSNLTKNVDGLASQLSQKIRQ